MDYTLRRLDKSSIPAVAHLLRQDERLALKYDPAMGGVAALCGGVGVGVLIFLKTGRNLSVRSLMVSSGFRQNGIGSSMLKTVCATARLCGMLVTVPFSADGVSSPVYRFIIASGLSVRRQGGFTAEIGRKALEDSFERSKKLIKEETTGFFTLSAAQRRDFSQRIHTAWPYVAFQLRYGLKAFDGASCCTVSGNKISAASLISWNGKTPQIGFLYADPGCGRMAMSALLNSVSKLLSSSDFDTLTVTITNAPSQGILNKLCTDYTIIERLYTAYDTGL